MCEGFVVLTIIGQRTCEVIMGLCVLRITSYGFVVMLQGSGAVTLYRQRKSETAVSPCKIRIDTDGRLKVLDGPVVVALNLQRETEVVARSGMLRIDPHGFPIVFEAPVEAKFGNEPDRHRRYTGAAHACHQRSVSLGSAPVLRGVCTGRNG